MEYPLFQVIKNVEQGTVGVTGVNGLSDEEMTAVVFAVLETARRNSSVDNLLRLVANTRRFEEPKDIDTIRICKEDIGRIAGKMKETEDKGTIKS